MSPVDWRRVIDEAAAGGVTMIQFIGGEPTTHPAFCELVDHALAAGVEVEVFSNLHHIAPAMWQVFARSGVRLATSYYSDDADQHDAITTRRGSHARTRANIAEAVRRRIPVRVGIIDLGEDQRTEQAPTDLETLGVPRDAIGYDRLRAFGRGAVEGVDETDTCGHCGHGSAAVGPDGDVWPCVFTRRVAAGNVLRRPLADILAGDSFAARVAYLDGVRRDREAKCEPFCYPCSPCPPCRPSCGPTG